MLLFSLSCHEGHERGFHLVGHGRRSKAKAAESKRREPCDCGASFTLHSVPTTERTKSFTTFTNQNAW